MSNDSRNTHPRLRAPTVLAAALLACTALAGCDRAKPQAVPAVSTAGTEAARAGVFEISAKGLDLKDGTDAKLYLMDQAFEPGPRRGIGEGGGDVGLDLEGDGDGVGHAASPAPDPTRPVAAAASRSVV